MQTEAVLKSKKEGLEQVSKRKNHLCSKKNQVILYIELSYIRFHSEVQ